MVMAKGDEVGRDPVKWQLIGLITKEAKAVGNRVIVIVGTIVAIMALVNTSAMIITILGNRGGMKTTVSTAAAVINEAMMTTRRHVASENSSVEICATACASAGPRAS